MVGEDGDAAAGGSAIDQRQALQWVAIGEEAPAKPYTAVREAVEIVREALSGEAVSYRGREFSADIPPLKPDADAPRWCVPLYIAGTGPRLQRAAGEIAARAGAGRLVLVHGQPEFDRAAAVEQAAVAFGGPTGWAVQGAEIAA